MSGNDIITVPEKFFGKVLVGSFRTEYGVRLLFKDGSAMYIRALVDGSGVTVSDKE